MAASDPSQLAMKLHGTALLVLVTAGHGRGPDGVPEPARLTRKSQNPPALRHRDVPVGHVSYIDSAPAYRRGAPGVLRGAGTVTGQSPLLK